MVIYLVDHKRYTSLQSARKAAYNFAVGQFVAHPRKYHDKEITVKICKPNKEIVGIVGVRSFANLAYFPRYYADGDLDSWQWMAESGRLIPNSPSYMKRK